MALSKNVQTGLKVGGAIVSVAAIYFGFIKKDADGLTQWAKLMGKNQTGPAVKPATTVNPNSDRTPDSESTLDAAGKVPRSKQGYWKNGSWYHY